MDASIIKQQITEKSVVQIIKSLGGELVEEHQDYFRFTSITYATDADNHKAKLYYYRETKLFVEYHVSMETFDIFELIKQRQKLLGNDYNFINCLQYVCNVLGIDGNSIQAVNTNTFVNAGLSRFTSKASTSELKIFNEAILSKFEDVYHQSWLDDNISIDTMKKYNIKYYKYGCQIIIPCYNQYNQLIGIRARNLDPLASAKYIPYKDINGTWYKFNVGSTFYGLNHTYKAIQKLQRAIICESEKSVLQGDTYFGEHNIIVGMFGSAMTKAKRDLLLSFGVKEIVIAIDFDYEQEAYSNQELYEPKTDWEIYVEKVDKIYAMFCDWCKVSVIIDNKPKHKKDCITDYGREEFLKFYNQRVMLN